MYYQRVACQISFVEVSLEKLGREKKDLFFHHKENSPYMNTKQPTIEYLKALYNCVSLRAEYANKPQQHLLLKTGNKVISKHR